jgi:hypothetical protein
MRIIGDVKIDPKQVLWRYLRPERLSQVLANASFYFASANEFADPFEGAVAIQTTPTESDPRYAEMESGEVAFRELKRLTKINCWHQAEYESDAMWQLYAGANKGIALCTTPERMFAAFRPFRLKPEYGEEDLWAGRVEYVDLTQVRLKRVGMLDRFFIKHRAFEWEREFRLAISLRPAEEFAVQVPPEGIFVDVDLDVLVEHVVLGTTMSSEERRRVTEALEAAGLADRTRLSTLLGRPRYV